MNPNRQEWNVGHYQQFASFVPQLGQALLDLLKPKSGERVLDLGCGDGVLTEKLIHMGCEIVAIDSNLQMVEAARARGINASVMDVRELRFQGEFDAVFSNAVLHWVREPELAISGIARALKHEGRFVAEFGGLGNIKTIEDALIKSVERVYPDGRSLSPWYYPAPEDYRVLLEKHGLLVDTIALIPRPTPLPNGMRGWLTTFAGSFLKPFPELMHEHLLQEAEALMTSTLCDKNGNWHADYVRLRVSARKL